MLMASSMFLPVTSPLGSRTRSLLPMTRADYQRMVNDAEKFKDEDDKQKERISAKNGLESYCFNMKTTIEDDKVKDKISDDDKKKISGKCDEAIKWLDANQLGEVDEFNE